jgi:O-antigen/teichoic acid export membrane protein
VTAVRRTEPQAPRDAATSFRALAHQAGWNYGALILQLGGSFALFALAFRQLPRADVGAFALAAVTLGLVQILDPAAGYVMSRIVAENEAGRHNDEPVVAEVRAGLRTVAWAVAAASALGLTLAVSVHAPGLGVGRVVMVSCVVAASCVQLASASLPATALGLGDYRGLFDASAIAAVVTLVTAWALLHPFGVAALGVALLAGQISGRGLLLVRRLDHGRLNQSVAPALGLEAVRRLWHHSGAIYLSSLAAQLLSVSDLWTVGAFRGVQASAGYRAGTMIPTQASSLFYRVYDVLYPRLPRMSDPATQERAVALATRIFSASGGCLFLGLFLERGPLTRLLAGSTDTLAEQVFAVFCAIWLVNLPVHGIALLLISRGQYRVITPVVLAEAAANVALSVGLVWLMGPVGAAVGTLATMAISNLVVLPLVVERLVPGALRLTWVGTAWCVLGLGVGGVVQAPAALGLGGPAGAIAVVVAVLVSAGVAAWVAAGRDGREVLRAHV